MIPEIRVYPNPTQGDVTFHWLGGIPNEGVVIRIWNINGQLQEEYRFQPVAQTYCGIRGIPMPGFTTIKLSVQDRIIWLCDHPSVGELSNLFSFNFHHEFMRYHLPLFGLLIIPVLLMGQTGFINHYDFDSPGAVITDMLLDGDTLYVVGIKQANNPPYIQGFFLAQMDTLGHVVKTHTYYDSLQLNYGVAGFPSGFIQKKDKSGFSLLVVFSKRQMELY
ncbi:MAG: hypothetical protein R2787_13255 [Saprospiraceae bacterium]